MMNRVSRKVMHDKVSCLPKGNVLRQDLARQLSEVRRLNKLIKEQIRIIGTPDFEMFKWEEEKK